MSSNSNESLPMDTNKNGLLLNSKRNLRSARSEASTTKTEQPEIKNDHYLLMEIKDGKEEDDIDFVLTNTPAQHGIRTECLEEIEFTEKVPEDAAKNGDDNTKVQTIVEHICGKCYQFFRSIKSLKRHMEYCNFNSDMIMRREEMLKNIDKIEKEAAIMEKKDVCFCCGDSYDTCHLGHINCADCPKSFKTQLSLERHVFLIHSEKDDFPCTICNGKIRSKAILQLHIDQHKNRGKPFACKTCGKDFTRKYHLKRHENFSPCGKNQSELFKCKACDRVFHRLDNLRSHLKQHLNKESTKKQEYRCPCCKNCFYSLSTLNIHIRTHTGERPFDCDLCEKNFPSLVSLKKHRRYHTGEKPYCCSVCNQHFAVKEVLNRHMKRHTDDKPHVCSECGKRFIQATQLKKHVNVHRRPFECSMCPEKFKTQKQAEKHEREHNKATRKHLGKYWCHDCDMQYFRHGSLIKHEHSLEHIEKATKLCEHCNKQFVGIKSLTFHMLKEHEFKCNQCEMVFAKKDLLRQHSEEMHGAPSVAEDDEMIVDECTESIDEKPQLQQQNEACSTNAPIVLKVENQTLANSVQTDQGCFVIEEFIVEALPADEMQVRSENKLTVSPQTGEVLPKLKEIKKPENERSRNLKAEFKKLLQESMVDDDDKSQININDDILITKNVGKLLDMLVDVKTISKFGWPDKDVEEVLCKVIENCGHNLNRDEFADDYGTRMREYVKLLFTVVIQNNSIEELLNNYTIDEVIELVLSNDDVD